MAIRVSETEVSNIRNVGDLAFTVGNEIMTVGVAASQTLVPGDIVDINATGYASKVTTTAIDTSLGYGVVIHQGVTTTAADTTGQYTVQIAVGNTYIALKIDTADATTFLAPLARVTTSTTNAKAGWVVQQDAPTDAATTIAYIIGTIGRYFGHPGEVVSPTKGADTEIGIVRLGTD